VHAARFFGVGAAAAAPLAAPFAARSFAAISSIGRACWLSAGSLRKLSSAVDALAFDVE
jgi:hypothetical protein